MNPALADNKARVSVGEPLCGVLFMRRVNMSTRILPVLLGFESSLTTDLGVGGSNPSGRATFQVLTKQDYRQCVQNVSTARIPNDRRKATGVENG